MAMTTKKARTRVLTTAEAQLAVIRSFTSIGAHG
jgi:hypothetical protein